MRVFNFLFLFLIALFFSGLMTDFAQAEISGKILFDLQNLCGKNHFESCGQLGLYYRSEIKDLKLAVPYYEKACSGGRSGSCMHLSSIYMTDIPDIDKQLQFAKRACELGESNGCAMAGLGLSLNFKDEASASIYFKLACDANNTIGCDSLGDYYASESEKLSEHIPKALETYQKACNLKSEISCDNLRKLKQRISNEEDCNRKKNSIEKTCEIKDCSEDILSFIKQGCGIFKTEEVIIPLFEKNCLKFKSTSCHEASGLHLAQNRFQETIRFSALSCENGNHYSCSINKYANAMIDQPGSDIQTTANELASGCFEKNLSGDCELLLLLLKNKNFQSGIDIKKLSAKGCSLNSSGLCISEASFTPKKEQKLKLLQKACDLENQLGCLEAGKLLKDGHFIQKLKALNLLRLSCNGHQLDNPVEFGCGELAILEAEFNNLIPSSKNLKLILFSVVLAVLVIYVVIRFRRRLKALRSLEEKTLALEGEFNKKRKEEILSALDKIE